MLKRAFDVVVGVVGLIVLLPVLVMTSVLVRVRLGPPILFRQTRPGRNGRPFTVFKFRSMLHGNEPDDERLTNFGRRLRATSLDELPELLNIVRGDMSFVGPRPLLLEYLPHYTERQSKRHEVRPGLTGLAQVSGRNSLDWATRLELDVRYVEQRSLLLDMQIIVRTVRQVLTSRDVAADGHATMPRFDLE